MIQRQRIPASHAPLYTAWSLPVVTASRVIHAQGSQVRLRRAHAADMERIEADVLKQELEEGKLAERATPGDEAEKMEAIVAASIAAGHEQGYAAGHAEGFEQGEREGRLEGLAAGRRQVEEAARRFTDLLQALHAPLREQDEALREAMLAAVLQITRTVLRVETRLQPEHIVPVLDEALSALPPGAHGVRVFVSPADRELLEDFGEGEAVPSLLVDPDLVPGDCRVETEDSLVDFTQAARFAAIAEQFLGTADVGKNSSS